MDWQQWIKQTLPRTEIMRGGATVWPAGGNGLLGDTLGPVMHLHDGASEVYYFPFGRCRLEVGDREEIFEAGDFVLVPPEVPHNFWNGGDSDVGLFWIVAPHRMDNKWRTEAITPDEMRGRVVRARPEANEAGEVELPGDANIRSRLIAFPAHAPLKERSLPRHEAVIYVKSGKVSVMVGKLGGDLDENEFVHVPANTAYSVAAAAGPAEIFVFNMPGGAGSEAQT